MSRNPKHVSTLTTVLVTLLIVLMIAATGLIIWLCISMVQPEQPQVNTHTQNIELLTPSTAATTEPTQEPTTEPPPVPEHVVSTATVAAMGDLVMHMPVVNTCVSGGVYDFTPVFKYLKDTVSLYDYAVINLETSLGGPDIPYSGFPLFNSPDAIVDGARDAGFHMLMTANNHSGDTRAEGIVRTLEMVREKGMATVGSQLEGEKKYAMVNVNDIQLGMLCYTYATGETSDGRPRLNGNAALTQAGLINYFVESNLPAFYTDVESQIQAMREEGAEAIILFIHWGVEYQMQENATQQAMAQKLCDLGVDAIIGSHPHVVEPVALIESTVDPSHKAVCIYSLGNAVSNQRTGISSLFPPGYTEDGALFTVTFEKYSDGKVYLAGADVVPTWVNMHQNNGPKEYNILPLVDSQREQWQSLFNLTDANLAAAEKSYDRTLSIVGEGLEVCKAYLEQAKADREQYYYDLAWNPEKLQPQETAPATVETTGETLSAAA